MGLRPPVGTRTPRVLGSSEPTSEEPLRGRGAQGGSGSNPPNWISNSRVHGEPVQSDTGQLITIVWSRHVRLERRVTVLAYDEVSPGVAAISAPPRGANTAPLRRAFTTPCFYGVGGLFKNHQVIHRDGVGGLLENTELAAIATTAGWIWRSILVLLSWYFP